MVPLPGSGKGIVLFDAYYLCPTVTRACGRNGFRYVGVAKKNSMVDLALMAKLLQAVPTAARLILLGVYWHRVAATGGSGFIGAWIIGSLALARASFRFGSTSP